MAGHASWTVAHCFAGRFGDFASKPRECLTLFQIVGSVGPMMLGMPVCRFRTYQWLMEALKQSQITVTLVDRARATQEQCRQQGVLEGRHLAPCATLIKKSVRPSRNVSETVQALRRHQITPASLHERIPRSLRQESGPIGAANDGSRARRVVSRRVMARRVVSRRVVSGRVVQSWFQQDRFGRVVTNFTRF